MRLKLLMRWDIDNNNEAEYYEFIVNEFIPRVKRLGLSNIQFWYTTYGDCEKIQASGVSRTEDQMWNILNSDEWKNLQTRLTDYVENYSSKVIQAVDGFQV